MMHEVQFSCDINNSFLLPECSHYVNIAIHSSLVFFCHINKLAYVCFHILGAIFNCMENQIQPLTRMLLLLLKEVWIKV
jgi:hypothetical protein